MRRYELSLTEGYHPPDETRQAKEKCSQIPLDCHETAYMVREPEFAYALRLKSGLPYEGSYHGVVFYYNNALERLM